MGGLSIMEVLVRIKAKVETSFFLAHYISEGSSMKMILRTVTLKARKRAYQEVWVWSLAPEVSGGPLVSDLCSWADTDVARASIASLWVRASCLFGFVGRKQWENTEKGYNLGRVSLGNRSSRCTLVVGTEPVFLMVLHLGLRLPHHRMKSSVREDLRSQVSYCAGFSSRLCVLLPCHSTLSLKEWQ